MSDTTPSGIEKACLRVAAGKPSHPVQTPPAIRHRKRIQERAQGYWCVVSRSHRRHVNSCNLRQMQAQPFIRSEEKRFALYDWTTECAAKIVMIELRFRQATTVGKPIVRAQKAAPKILKH